MWSSSVHRQNQLAEWTKALARLDCHMTKGYQETTKLTSQDKLCVWCQNCMGLNLFVPNPCSPLTEKSPIGKRVGSGKSLNYSIERLELPCYRSSWEAELPSKQRMSLLFGWRLSPPRFDVCGARLSIAKINSLSGPRLLLDSTAT